MSVSLSYTLTSIRGKLNPAYVAAIALIAIQVGIGICYKAAQHQGQYSFSVSASVAISEFFKLVLSTCFFYGECKRRNPLPVTEYRSIPQPERDSLDEKQVLIDPPAELSESSSFTSEVTDERPAAYVLAGDSKSDFTIRDFLGYCIHEVPIKTKYGFAQLALLYALINNCVFVLYRLADPGTIQLIKSGITLITALVLYYGVGTRIVKTQWVAIFLQIAGVVVTQYRPGVGAPYAASTYLILIFKTFLSATSSVYNQSLIKSQDASLHSDNMVLYACGVTINSVIHFTLRIVNPEEPGFFVGYHNWGAIIVIISNVFFGLAITAVYKYADALVKCLATAIATSILLYVSPILFHVWFNPLVIPGSMVVFLATWLYMEATPKGGLNSIQATSTLLGGSSKVMRTISSFAPGGRLRGIGLLTNLLVSLVIISHLTLWGSKSPDNKFKQVEALGASSTPKTPKYQESPFKNTFAFIRWNSPHEERMPLMEAYQPFFHSLHYSIPHLYEHTLPNNGEEEDAYFLNMTHDGWNIGDLPTKAVADTMQLILDDPDNGIEGMLYFHFDAWIDPFGFQNMDFDGIWFPDSPNPRYLCMNTPKQYPEWHGWWGMHEITMHGERILEDLNVGYVINTTEWCVGWSDIYYLPRRLFPDYIFLNSIFFGQLRLFHEVAIPSMLRIIDDTRRSNPTESIITRLGDCWGHCCADGVKREDVLWRRCGHRLDFTREEIWGTHWERLGRQAEMLGKKVGKVEGPTQYH
ncbi:hypothetical protein M501DRAFT_772361 [Patellaria atrata CBS 101060]|uniref:UDP-galactose transporter n=1 Tax=Patellaria atrata CBS 101060 TaxID=1346257 RepID=A0A9P4VT46_9PEZI|nr:hypothetical protein M501DRAFT_772361 [Patellaria atrata CBS 101060]